MLNCASPCGGSKTTLSEVEDVLCLQLLWWRKNPSCYGLRKFVSVFKEFRYWILFWASRIQSVPLHPISRRLFLISSHWGLWSFPTKILHACLVFAIRVTCLSWQPSGFNVSHGITCRI
jgi:hypothetical protein